MSDAAPEPLTILLADDMAHFLDLEVSFLRRADCRILTAADGAQALVMAKQERPDLLLLDVEMPRMTGIEVCRLLRQDPRFAETPIVMVTSTERRAEAEQAGATAFWRKPIRERAFMDGIQDLVPIKIREQERIAVGLPAVLRTGAGEDPDGMTRDVSVSGAFLLSKQAPEPGGEATVRIALGFEANADTVELSGTVARVQTGEDGGVGVEFTGPEDQLAKLASYLDTLEG